MMVLGVKRLKICTFLSEVEIWSVLDEQLYFFLYRDIESAKGVFDLMR